MSDNLKPYAHIEPGTDVVTGVDDGKSITIGFYSHHPGDTFIIRDSDRKIIGSCRLPDARPWLLFLKPL